jgi:hypothetical protein
MILLVFIIISTSNAQITWMGNENFFGNNSWLGDKVEVTIQSYPKELNQGAQIHIDWQNNDTYDEWFNLPFRYESGSNNEWRSVEVQMKQIGTHKRRYLGWQNGQSDYISGSFGTFIVNALNNPTPGTLVASNNSIELVWEKDGDSHDVLILRKTSDQEWIEPSQGTTYNTGDLLGNVKVVYRGNLTSWTDNELSQNVTYNYKFYTENWSYYSAGVTADPVTTTPVELTSFKAKLNDNSVKLSWQTATEINNYGFEIERSAVSGQMSEWTKIGFVKGNGNSNSTKNYSFTDNAVSKSGKYAYRLKQVDNDGSFTYSQIVETDVTVNLSYSLGQNYPNPFNPTTKISYTIPETGLVTLKVYNIVGEHVAELVNKTQEAGKYEIEFNGSSLSNGVYFYELKANGFTSVKKLMLLK